MTRNLCPICAQHYAAVDKAAQVCDRHQSWLVTVCDKCGETKFSETAGACTTCYPDDMSIYNRPKGSADHRAPLRYYGLEGWE